MEGQGCFILRKSLHILTIMKVERKEKAADMSKFL